MVENTNPASTYKATPEAMVQSSKQKEKQDRLETEKFFSEIISARLNGGKIKIGLDLAAGVGRYRKFLEGICTEVYSNDIDAKLLTFKHYDGVDKQYLVHCDVNEVLSRI